MMRYSFLIIGIILLVFVAFLLLESGDAPIPVQQVKIREWQHSFECQNLEECIQGVRDKQGRLQPIGQNFTFRNERPNAGEPEGARIELSTVRSHSGEKSLYSYVPKGEFEILSTGVGETSKAMIARHGFIIERNDAVEIEAWLYIPSTQTGRLSVVDIEDSKGFGGPGIRFFLDDQGAVIFNRDKLGIEPAVFKGEIEIPKDKWFNIRIAATISEEEDRGHVSIFLDEKEVLSVNAATAGPSIEFYDSIQFGITSRLKEPFEMWTDDVSVNIK